MSRFVYSVGLGPGEPELITLKALKILQASDVVVVPQSDETGRSIAKDIVSYHIGLQKIFMYYFPMNNKKAELDRRYAELADTMQGFLESGKMVSFVTMGEPTIFSTSNYLTRSLNDLGIEVRHIPGISSINAAASRLGVPLCVKGEHFGVYELPTDVWTVVTLMRRHPATVFMKVSKGFGAMIEALDIVKPERAYLVQRVGLEEERVYDMLESVPPREATYLSIVIIKRAPDTENA
ncbi:MAG: precorrin-2 C(20)-methyltransferase [Candidatus Magnetoovum sp. WYHC-5]|nr:precorrin-2 C(20)-methyltransferase [Candidatus Magnetoovum sp. WYHC-5]